jgi:hypothetical protein
MSDKSSETVTVPITVEAARMIRDIAPPTENQNIKSRIARAASRLGWSFNRAKDVWYGDQRISIRAAEIAALRSALAKKSVTHVAIRDASRLEAAATALSNIDAEFHRNEIEHLRLLARHLRGQAPFVGEG